MNRVRGFGPMLIMSEDLARTLEANALMLVGDGACFSAGASVKKLQSWVLLFCDFPMSPRDVKNSRC
jgi:hypothetical protein